MNVKYKYVDNNSNKLIIIFQGAIPQKYTEYDYDSEEFNEVVSKLHDNYNWYNLTTNKNFDFLYIADNFNKLMSWYIASDDTYIVEEFSDWLDKFISSKGYNASNVTTFGSSKGGYGALIYGLICSNIDNVVSIVPQIELSTYFDKGIKEEIATKYIKKSFEKINNKYMDNILYDLSNSISNEKSITIFTSENDTQFSEQKKLYGKIKNKDKFKIYTAIDKTHDHGKVILAGQEVIKDYLFNMTSRRSKYTPDLFSEFNVFPNNNNPKIGITCDINYYRMLENSANLQYVNLENYKFMDDIDVYIYMTTWKGVYEDIKYTSEINSKIIEIIQYFNDKGIETIFYSKEDPPYFETFIDVAKKCKRIFTSSQEKVNEYKIRCSNENVYYSPYPVNTNLFNPLIEKINDKDFHFAGSYFTHAYPERHKDQAKIFNSIINSRNELFIRDRNTYMANEKFAYPLAYKKYVKDGVPYIQLAEEQSSFVKHVNINSIKYDTTMCAVRAMELQAADCEIYSNYSVSLADKFPNIYFITMKNEIEYYENLHTAYKKDIRDEGIRNIFRYNLNSYDFINRIMSRGNYYDISVLVVANFKTKFQTYNNIKVVTKEQYKKNKKFYKYDFVAFMDEKLDYSIYYIEDLVNISKFTTNKVISTNKNERYSEYLNQEVSIFKSLIAKSKISKINDEKIIDNITFASDMLIVEKVIEKSDEYLFSVVIPTYNNGKFLKNRCLRSLRKQENYGNIKIIIVDDGSTCQETIEIIKEEASKDLNIQTYFFEKGGSGSPSRPRNKGVELCGTTMFTFLDPDNELINDEYNYLANLMEIEKADFIIGKMQILSKTEATYPSFDLQKVNRNQALLDLDFSALSLQAGMFNTKFYKENVMESPDGVIGEDTLVFYDLLTKTRNFRLTNREIHKYYRLRSDSLINTISKKFAYDAEIIETLKRKIFLDNNILKEYQNKKLDLYFEKILLQRFSEVSIEDIPNSIEQLKKVIDIYGIDSFKSDIIRAFYFNLNPNSNLLAIQNILSNDNKSKISVSTNINPSNNVSNNSELTQLENKLAEANAYNASKNNELAQLRNKLIEANATNQEYLEIIREYDNRKFIKIVRNLRKKLNIDN